MRTIDVDAFISQERKNYCVSCKALGHDNNGAACVSCDVGEIIRHIDSWAKMHQSDKRGFWKNVVLDKDFNPVGYALDYSPVKQCTCCNAFVNTGLANYKYCPNCGANMMEG